jgi:hypothetical protein
MNKTTRNILLLSLVLTGLQFAWTGCVGVVGVDGGVVYGDGPWFREGPWLDGGGRGWYGGHRGGYVHPGGQRGHSGRQR